MFNSGLIWGRGAFEINTIYSVYTYTVLIKLSGEHDGGNLVSGDEQRGVF